jgi:multicomponent Na+:H+ antiporter subunit E
MLPSLILRVSIVTTLWCLLTEGDFHYWWPGICLALVATCLSITLIPLQTWPLSGLIRFIPFFVERSLKSCIDVAWRALRPGLHIDPILVRYPLKLPKGFLRIFTWSTLSACFQVHLRPIWMNLA